MSVLAFDVLGLGIPVLGNAFGNLLDLFSTSRSSLTKILREAPDGGFLLPGVMHISDDQIDLLFRRGGTANIGSSQLLKQNYAKAVGIPVQLIGGADRQYHHLIPIKVAQDSPLLRRLNFQVDAALNALPLNVAVHSGSHSSYNDALKRVLQRIESSGRRVERQRELVLSTITNASRAILEGESLKRSVLSVDEWIHKISPL